MVKDHLDLPHRQAKLRAACCNGDIQCELAAFHIEGSVRIQKFSHLHVSRLAERLLSTHACWWRALLHRFLSIKVTQVLLLSVHHRP